MRDFETTFRSSAGEDLRVRGWLPDGEARAVLHFHHGVTSHMDQNADAGRWFAERGFAFVGHDCLGHGRGAFERGRLGWFAEADGWQHVTDDYAALDALLGQWFPGKRRFLLGSSMGSFVVRSFLIRYPEARPAGALLFSTSMNSPALLRESYARIDAVLAAGGDPRRGSKALQGFAFGDYCRRIPDAKTPFDWVCSDMARLSAKPNDGYSMFLLSPGLFRDMTDGQVFNADPENLRRMRPETPVLLVSGAADPAGNYGEGPRQVRDAFWAAGVRDVTLRLYGGERHELFQGLRSGEVLTDTLGWIERYL